MFINVGAGLLLKIPRHANEKDNAPTAQVPNKKDSDVKQLITTTMTYQEKAEEFADAMYNYDGIEYRHNGAYYVPADDDLPW